MARVSVVTSGAIINSTTFGNALITDYLSQTDTNEQNIASHIIFAAGKKPTMQLARFSSASAPGSPAAGDVYFNGTQLLLYDGTAWRDIPIAITGGGAKQNSGTATGTSPITVAHGLGSSPTVVLVSPYAVQPYAFAYSKNATNIIIYHNAAGSLTFSWYARV